MKPLLSIIYVYYNTPLELKHSVESLKQALGKISFEVIIVDNASVKSVPLEVSKLPEFRIIKNKKNCGYGKGLNQGAEIAKGRYLLLLNPDVFFTKDAISSLLKKIEKERAIGVIGPKILNQKGEILQSISGFPSLARSLFVFSFLSKIWPNHPLNVGYHNLKLDRTKEQMVEAVGGACMLVRKSLFEKIKGFDERFFMYFEEADFCFRIRKLGHKILYYPKSEVIHLISKSTKDRKWIEKTFEESRFIFLKKYYGLLPAAFAEVFLRLTEKHSIILTLILIFSAFLNLYKIDTLMMFIGDMGRDYLAARDMILFGKIPLVGITSSVLWLHQGPISVYSIALSFALSNFHPVSPAILYGIFAVISTSLVYKLGAMYFNRYVGLLSSAFYATSPLIVVNARMPYHTSLIPLFSAIFFLVLLKVLKNERKFLPVLFFVLGLLLQVELSNAVLFFVVGLLFFLKRYRLKIGDILKSLLGFILGILPFILYDLTHQFLQTIGLPIWIINRIRLFFGLTFSGNSTFANTPQALQTIAQQLTGILFPGSPIIVVLIIAIIFFAIIKNREINLRIILLTLIISLIGFIIHTTPGTAYFPLLFPIMAVLVGFSFYFLIKRHNLLMSLFVLIIILNALSTIKNDYFLTTKKGSHPLPPYNYSYGTTWTLQDEVAQFIIADANGRVFKLLAKGSMANFKTGINNFEYLVWKRGGKIEDRVSLNYGIYQNRKEVGINEKIIYDNKFFYVVKNEN